MSEERQAKDNSPAKTVATFEPGGLPSSPKLFRTGPGYKMGRSRKKPSFTLGDWKTKWGLRLVVLLGRQEQSPWERQFDSFGFFALWLSPHGGCP